MTKIITGCDKLNRENLVELYRVLGWSKYTENPDGLFRAVLNSTYVVSVWEKERLLGLARSLSDDVAIHYIQDILVHPDYQRQGLGRMLLEKCLKRFEHVRSHVLLTDNEERQRLFYHSLGFVSNRELKKYVLNCYIKMNGVELE